MKIFRKQNVYDAAIERINWLFDEFPVVTVAFSGGKDSTVALQLTLKVAEERDRLPVKVLFVDQEAEWQCTIDYTRSIAADPRVDMAWLQMPIMLSNGNSQDEAWLKVWDPDADWMRTKEADSIKENVYGTMAFYEVFNAFYKHHYPGVPVAQVGGMRAEESPSRFVNLGSFSFYKGETWGSRLNRAPEHHFKVSPLYDWSYTDIWKAIHDHGWPYCSLYDWLYQHGTPVHKMRVSSLCHETASSSLLNLQEVEPDTWAALTKRLKGISTMGQLGAESFSTPKELPFMFADWKEYRDYLIANLVEVPDVRRIFTEAFEKMDAIYVPVMENPNMLWKRQVRTVIMNDYHLTTMDTVLNQGTFRILRRLSRRKQIPASDFRKFGKLAHPRFKEFYS